MFNIHKLEKEDLVQVASLFNEYRIFYEQKGDEELCYRFLEERLQKRESEIFLCFKGAEIIGFVQLYPCFSSLSLKSQWVLNDLFVKKEFRGMGAAKLLMEEASRFAKLDRNCRGMTLKTASTNIVAQKLYLKEGWQEEKGFISFNLNFS